MEQLHGIGMYDAKDGVRILTRKINELINLVNTLDKEVQTIKKHEGVRSDCKTNS